MKYLIAILIGIILGLIFFIEDGVYKNLPINGLIGFGFAAMVFSFLVGFQVALIVLERRFIAKQ